MSELIASLDGPSGAPVLVLGNSLGTSAMVWERQAAALRGHFRLLRYELPGHGGAPAWPGPYTVGGLGSAVLAVLGSYDVERAAYCGISLGGMIGMWLAANVPDQVSGLAVVCSSAWLPPADGWRARADLVRREGMAPVTEASTGRWFTPEFTRREPGLTSSFAAELERVDPAGYAGCCLAIADMDLRGCLGEVTAPTLVVSGGRDPVTTPEHGAEIAARIGGARHVVLPDASHLASVSAPEEVTSALLDHFGRA